MHLEGAAEREVAALAAPCAWVVLALPCNPSAPTGLACGFRHVLCFRKGGREEGLKRSLIKGKKVVVVVVVVFVVVVVGDVVVLWVKMACSVG